MTGPADTTPVWPQCGEPYASSLRQFAQRWIAGELSDGDLALEILELQQRVIYAEREAREDGRRMPSALGTARREISILAQTLAEYHAEPMQMQEEPTAEERQIAFDVALADCRQAATYHRGW